MSFNSLRNSSKDVIKALNETALLVTRLSSSNTTIKQNRKYMRGIAKNSKEQTRVENSNVKSRTQFFKTDSKIFENTSKEPITAISQQMRERYYDILYYSPVEDLTSGDEAYELLEMTIDKLMSSEQLFVTSQTEVELRAVLHEEFEDMFMNELQELDIKLDKTELSTEFKQRTLKRYRQMEYDLGIPTKRFVNETRKQQQLSY